MNNRTRRCIELNVFDLPTIRHAFQIAANTALMSGNSEVKKHYEKHIADLDRQIPEEFEYFDDEIWCAIGLALNKEASFRLGMIPYYTNKGFIGVEIGSQTFQSNFHKWVRADDPIFHKLLVYFEDFGPDECAGRIEHWEKEKKQ